MKDFILTWVLLETVLICTIKPVREYHIEWLKSLDRKNRL